MVVMRGDVGVVVCDGGGDFPCHWHLPLYDVGYVSTSNRCCCPCFVVGFRLPLDLCLCSRRCLGEAVWQDSFGGGEAVWRDSFGGGDGKEGVVVLLLRGDVVVVVLRWLWWR